jgi:hypothetical protein
MSWGRVRKCIHIHMLLISSVVACEWPVSHPFRFIPKDGAQGYDVTMWRSEHSRFHRGSIPDSSVVQPMASRSPDYTVVVLMYTHAH